MKSVHYILKETDSIDNLTSRFGEDQTPFLKWLYKMFSFNDRISVEPAIDIPLNLAKMAHHSRWKKIKRPCSMVTDEEAERLLKETIDELYKEFKND